MKRTTLKTSLLFAVIVGVTATAFAVTDEINRVAEQADKLYVVGRYSEAFPLMKRAAEGGDMISMFNLGTMYYNGQGTTKNQVVACRWWTEAANNGDELAREMLNQLNSTINNPTKSFTVNGVTFTMVYVEGGTFTMGATSEQGSDAFSDEKPAHQVTLSSFSIGQTEVTQALWQAVMGSNPSHFIGDLRRPVENVRWNDCQTFITKLNQLTGQTFRMPSEAEWEYTARGGILSSHYKYSGSNNVYDVAWYSGDSSSQTHAVGTKSPNELGLYDMSGNVYEWCWDRYDSYSYVLQINPTGPAWGTYRVYRGGGWYSFTQDCRVSYRNSVTPSSLYNFLGLRLAL